MPIKDYLLHSVGVVSFPTNHKHLCAESANKRYLAAPSRSK